MHQRSVSHPERTRGVDVRALATTRIRRHTDAAEALSRSRRDDLVQIGGGDASIREAISASGASLGRLAPKSKSLAHCGKIATGYRCYQSALYQRTRKVS